MSDEESDEPRSFFKRLFSSNTAGETDGKGAGRQVLMDAAENFHVLTVEDVMVPRADIIAVDSSASLGDLVKAFVEAGHSRLPIYTETLDEPTGMVHIKDLLPYLAFDAKGRNAKSYPDKQVGTKIEREVLFVPPSMAAEDLLRKMQARRMHMAIVVDEYGGTDGLVTLEDLIEPIVGEIEDEHDEHEPQIKTLTDAQGNPYWEADARVSIDEFEDVFGRDIATPEEDDEVDTLGGVVFSLAGRVPQRGEVISHPYGIEFEVLDADPRRIQRLRVRQTRNPLEGP